MNFSVVSEFFTVSRVGWMLMHSVWQGSVVAVGLVVVLVLMRNRSARARYLCACIALLLCLLAPVATVIVTRPAEVPIQNATISVPGEISSTGAANLVQLRINEELPFLRSLERFIPYTVYVWSFGVIALCLRMSVGFGRVQAWKGNGYQIIDERWTGALRRCAKGLGLSRSILLLQSARVTVPMTIGFIRPAVLIPASLASGLTPLQIQGILAHELAHICRHDYLVNLIQTTIETLLFFHPAVRWIGQVIRQERENCCDDLAADVIGSPRDYAATLVRVEELCQADPAVSLAMTGGLLLPRIQRLLGKPQPRTVFNGHLAAALSVLLIVVGCMHKSEPARTEITVSQDEAVLKPRNRIDVLVTGHGVQRDIHVPENRIIVINELGAMNVSNLTPKDLENEIEARFRGLGQNVTAQVSLRPEEADLSEAPHPPVPPSPPIAPRTPVEMRVKDAYERIYEVEAERKAIEQVIAELEAQQVELRTVGAAQEEMAKLQAERTELLAEQKAMLEEIKSEQLARNRHVLTERQVEDLERQLASVKELQGGESLQSQKLLSQLAELRAQLEMLNRPGDLRPTQPSVPPTTRPREMATSPGEFYMTGDVPRVGVYALSPYPERKITIDQAIIAAGANVNAIPEARVKLIRRTDAGREEARVFSVQELLNAREGLIYLQSGDIVIVSNPGAQDAESGANSPLEKRLIEERSRLAKMSAELGENHPTLVRQKRQVETLERQLAPARDANPATQPTTGPQN